MARATVVYDGMCGFCRRFRWLVAVLDWFDRFTWIDLHEADYDTLPVSEEECMQAMQVVDDDRIYAGFYATRRIFRSLPLMFPLFLLFHVPGVPWLGERVYRWVAAHRHCQISAP